jgi:unsaturated chondroitin disaccharide hydrolase
MREVFDLCIRKTRANIKRLAGEPKSGAWAVDGNYFGREEGFFHIDNWTSSFFTGMALLAWRATGDQFFLQQTLQLEPHYRAKVSEPMHRLNTMHDLGFLYSFYSVALHKLNPESGPHRDTGLQAAEELARRFNPVGNFIRAWGGMDTKEFADMAIIDCMMNLPLLFWASQETGESRFREIAVAHADTVLASFVRADDSVYHAYRFDLPTGRPARGDTYGGCTVESQWARGTAWAIYGFALAFGYTGDQRYLDAATRIARFFISKLDAEIVPLWDFKPGPDTPLIRDASAGSVAVCGCQELAKHGVNDPVIERTRRALLARLCREDYLNFDPNCPGIQQQGQVGNGKPGGAQNAYTSWGDYYLMEALSRELNGSETFW